MADRNSPDQGEYVVMVGTTFDGCKDPKGEGGEAAHCVTDDESWSSNRSSDMESVGDLDAATDFLNDSSASDDAEDPSPPGYFRSEKYTYSRSDEPGRKRCKIRAVVGIETPPSSPILHSIDDSDELDPRSQRPRIDDDTLDLDNLEALFPHMTRDEIKDLIPACERFRNDSYPVSHGSEENKNEPDNQQHAT